MAHLPTFRPAFADLRTGINLTFGAYQIYINHCGALRLTNITRAPAAAVATTAIEATPARVATLQVSHESQPNTRRRVTRDYSSGPAPWKKSNTHASVIEVRAPSQVFMADVHELTADGNGQDDDPSSPPDAHLSSKTSDPDNTGQVTITLGAPGTIPRKVYKGVEQRNHRSDEPESSKR